ncbi:MULTISPECIES: HAD family hydrolase [Mesorhizobium]|uniref:HAD family hydrolase n=1 Tax=Mesorhizobium denitrificans TaxID=2294114 RepID=A0A371XHX8_9HYPH|nr:MULTISPECIES: HAD family hydrolase [Mesorhizobium]RFC68835.1 HAD family hydrolase [Mesorhizobium denitrificans]
MPQPDLVIFDCDGVLIDSEIIAARVEAEVLTEAGYEISPEEIAALYSGLNFSEILLRVEKVAQIPLQASLIDRADAIIDKRLKDVRAIEGVTQAVAAVKVPRCICSNSSAERLKMTLGLTGLDRFFVDRVYSALSIPDGKPKPAPDVFLYAAGQMKANPANTFVVEDSVHGIHGAIAAGMRVIGFTGGAHSYPSHSDILTEAGAETVINRWRDLVPVLDALSEWAEA